MKTPLLRYLPPAWRPSLAFGLLAILAWSHFIENINSDGISYLTIARKYAHLDFGHALNAYWSPLISWLLAPGIALGIPELVWQKLLSTLLAMCGLRAQYALWQKAGLTDKLTEWAGYASLPLWGLFVFEAITPEPALMLIIVLYFLSFLHWIEHPSRKNALLLGLLGGLGYLCKAYFFPFFIAHLLLVGVVFLWNNGADKKPRFMSWAISLGMFLLVVGPWIGLISMQQGHFTLSAASRYNAVKYEMIDDGAHLMEQIGLVPPPNDLAVSVWEDITPYIPEKADEAADIQEKGKEFLVNTGKAIRIFHHKNLAFGVVWLLMLLAVFRHNTWWRDPWFHLMLAAGIYTGGYLLILVVDRYLWWIPLLTVGMSVQLWAWLPYFFKEKNAQKWLAGIFLIATVGLMPIYQLSKVADQGRIGFAMGREISALPAFETGKIASDAGYYPSTFLAYMVDAPYFGQLKYQPESRWESSLKAHDIRWFFVWETPQAFTEHYTEISTVPINGLRIFDLHTPKP